MVRRSVFVLAMVGALVASVGCRENRPDALEFTLENAGPSALDSVVVITTGYRYPLGHLAPGERRSVQVTATGESHFELEYGLGERRRLKVGGYFEPGYVGSYYAQVGSDSVLVTRDSIK